MIFHRLLLLIGTLLLSQTIWSASLPKNYETLEACKKQEVLWSKIKSSKHEKLPKYKKMGLTTILKMGVQKMTKKVKTVSDVAPKDWKKHLHQKGAVAKVKFVASPESQFTGVFKGAECALLRLSLTFRPTKKRGVAPGLALKFLRKGVESANISALYTLSGQEQEFNFFKNPLSNIVPIGSSFGQKIVHNIFERVTDYPEQLGVSDMASKGVNGMTVSSVSSPRQLFFVPNEDIARTISSDKHDVRKDFLEIPSGTSLYKVYSASPSKKNFNYYDYTQEDIKKFLAEAHLIGTLVTTSEFIASEFGDVGIFFKHQTKE
jgi:hypothetical protein